MVRSCSGERSGSACARFCASNRSTASPEPLLDLLDVRRALEAAGIEFIGRQRMLPGFG